MTTPDPQTRRARRPVPERTQPNRGILGVFGQRDWTGQAPTGHPLGFDDDSDDRPQAGAFLDEAVQQASDLVDRHIRDAAQETGPAATPGGIWGRLADSANGIDAQDLAKLATTLTKTYTDVAGLWVDLARDMADRLRGPQQAHAHPQPAAAVAPVPAPSIRLCAAAPVEARVDMFRPAGPLRAQPLGSDDPAQPARITEVAMDGGALSITVPPDQPTGTYHGVLTDDAGPAGAVTVTVFAPDDGGVP